MRSLLHRAILLAVVMLTIPAGIGFSVTRCAHSGEVAMDMMAGGDDCGMGAGPAGQSCHAPAQKLMPAALTLT